MAQHTLSVPNGSRTSVRTGLQSAVQAVGNLQKGPTAPSGAQPGWLWLQDTVPSASVWTLWLYDGAQWISLGLFDTTANTFLPTIGGTTRIFQIAHDTPGSGNITTGGSIEKNANGIGLFLSRSAFAPLHVNVNGDDQLAVWYRSGVAKGTISVNASAVAYNTTSDPLLKDRVSRLTDARERIRKVRIYSHGWKAEPDGPLVDGVMAPEFRRLFPWAVTKRRRQRIGGKTILVPMGVDYGKAVPATMAAVQEIDADLVGLRKVVRAQQRQIHGLVKALEKLVK